MKFTKTDERHFVRDFSKARRGSNQYRTKRRTTLNGLLGAVTLITLLSIPAYTVTTAWAKDTFNPIAEAPTKLVSPLPLDGKLNVEPTAIPTPVKVAELSEQESSIAVIKKVWRKDWKVGVAIAKCESGLRANAFNNKNINGSTDTGLFQINSVHGISKEDLMNPYANAGFAYSIFKEQGVNPWYSSEKCWKEKV